MESYVQKALALVDEIPASAATTSMKDLIEFVIDRKT